MKKPKVGGDKLAGYYRKIKTTTTSKATVPIKNKREMSSIMIYWLKRRDASKSKIKYFQYYRNYMICLLGFNTAFRAEDLLQLKVENLKKGYMSIIDAKTKKPNHYRLNNNLHKEILDYIERFELKDYDYLFTMNAGDYLPITPQRANKLLKEAAEGINLKQPFSLHSMRKTFAYQTYKDTGKLITVMKMLNHASPDITLLYICWDTTDMEIERENTYYSGV